MDFDDRVRHLRVIVTPLDWVVTCAGAQRPVSIALLPGHRGAAIGPAELWVTCRMLFSVRVAAPYRLRLLLFFLLLQAMPEQIPSAPFWRREVATTPYELVLHIGVDEDTAVCDPALATLAQDCRGHPYFRGG